MDNYIIKCYDVLHTQGKEYLVEDITDFVREPSLIDKSLEFYPQGMKVDDKKDNVRVYIPLDLNKDAILRRLDRVINQYEETSEENEMEFSIDVGMLVS